MDEKEGFVEIDPKIPEEGPSAPPPGWLDCVSGYEGSKGGEDPDENYHAPPPYAPPDSNQNAHVPNVREPTVSEDVAREALLKHVEKKWSYSSKPAKNLVFKDLKPITVYRYRLETYTELRSSNWASEPYRGQFVDGPENGRSPPPWEVPVPYPQKYTDVTMQVRVPHSCLVKPCHQCQSMGSVRCSRCFSRGHVRCVHCFGHGHRGVGKNRRRCTLCHGRGVRRCICCHGRGIKVCPSCEGQRNLLHFLQLTIVWKNNIMAYIPPDKVPEFPMEKLESVSGDAFFEDENLLVYPIVGFPDQEICAISKKGIEEHIAKFSSNRRILQQRQTIELVPVTQAFYNYHGKLSLQLQKYATTAGILKSIKASLKKLKLRGLHFISTHKMLFSRTHKHDWFQSVHNHGLGLQAEPGTLKHDRHPAQGGF
ncbi:protein SSUH2 homolog isoform X1 [Alosa pseudoharengus]|uniref:protein SSUH2 homolog isoform X1 n=1 Tax=Alosa pseudoharengus TaxID=34774 RepID=UPI003F88F47E